MNAREATDENNIDGDVHPADSLRPDDPEIIFVSQEDADEGCNIH